MTSDSRLPNFRTLTPAQRLAHIVHVASLSADGMIENVIGTFELPFAIAGNFLINGRDALVPIVVEEPSVVAAASFMAKLARG